MGGLQNPHLFVRYRYSGNPSPYYEEDAMNSADVSTNDGYVMKPKTFKARSWMLAGIREIAHGKRVSEGEWLRRVVLDALLKEGYDPQSYFTHNDH
jgi:hypothetical protein